MVMPASVDMYLHQWLSTAGEFSVDMAWQTNRMQLRCRECSAILRVPQLEKADEMPFVLQDWVSMHGYNGNHGVEPKPITVMLAPVPVTADFKSLPSKHGLPIQAGGWPEPLKAEMPSELNPKRVNAHIAKGRRFR
jgi:hypothetical protein